MAVLVTRWHISRAVTGWKGVFWKLRRVFISRGLRERAVGEGGGNRGLPRWHNLEKALATKNGRVALVGLYSS